FTVVSSIIYRQIEPFETAAVATLAREGFAQFVAPHYQPDGICRVAMLVVRPSFQHKGVGRGLLTAAGAFVGDADCESTVNSSPNAVSAFEHLDFHTVGAEQCIRGIRFIPMRRQSGRKVSDTMPKRIL